jgi:hypothetical protein
VYADAVAEEAPANRWLLLVIFFFGVRAQNNTRLYYVGFTSVASASPQTLICVCLHPQDVKFGAANLPAMNFMGGGAKNGQEWLEFLGTVKDKRVPPVGSPFQLDFNPGGNSTPVPPEITPAQERLPTCGDPLFQCSCADCPPAPGCQAVSVTV